MVTALPHSGETRQAMAVLAIPSLLQALASLQPVAVFDRRADQVHLARPAFEIKGTHSTGGRQIDTHKAGP